jgi:hypothetical protein
MWHLFEGAIVTSLPNRLFPARWLNWGAIALVLASLLYIFCWPGPEGLPLVKLGLSPSTINIEATVSGIKDREAQTRFQQGAQFKVIVDNAPPEPITIQSASLLPNTVAGTQPDGTVKAQTDPRPEMQFSQNLLLRIVGKGYANGSGLFIGLKRVRVGSTIRILAPDFETQASVVSVVNQSNSSSSLTT